MWSVAVFAHNESLHILRCLHSLMDEASNIDVYVLVNGSTDNTYEKVVAFAERHPWVHPVAIAIGCKCNAWNIFVHEMAPASDAYFFLDGDCHVYPNCLAELAKSLALHKTAYASAAFPAVGRNKEKWIAELLQSSIWGCLYALSPEAIRIIKTNNIHLPVNAIGDDSILEYLLLTNFRGGKDDRNLERIVPAPEARFHHDPISFLKFTHYIEYYKKQVRDSVRWLQCQILITKLKREGVQAMPESIDQLMILEEIGKIRLRNGIDGLFDRLALRKVLEKIQHP
uniref:Glycosyl transferase n=1 Tax=Desulfovibrio sp. U5L TaxID=596152 RepID=I2PZT9_9BACT